jgi:hypothetical protein
MPKIESNRRGGKSLLLRWMRWNVLRAGASNLATRIPMQRFHEAWTFTQKECNVSQLPRRFVAFETSRCVGAARSSFNRRPTTQNMHRTHCANGMQFDSVRRDKIM